MGNKSSSSSSTHRVKSQIVLFFLVFDARTAETRAVLSNDKHRVLFTATVPVLESIRDTRVSIVNKFSISNTVLQFEQLDDCTGVSSTGAGLVTYTCKDFDGVNAFIMNFQSVLRQEEKAKRVLTLACDLPFDITENSDCKHVLNLMRDRVTCSRLFQPSASVATTSTEKKTITQSITNMAKRASAVHKSLPPQATKLLTDQITKAVVNLSMGSMDEENESEPAPSTQKQKQKHNTRSSVKRGK